MLAVTKPIHVVFRMDAFQQHQQQTDRQIDDRIMFMSKIMTHTVHIYTLSKLATTKKKKLSWTGNKRERMFLAIVFVQFRSEFNFFLGTS